MNQELLDQLPQDEAFTGKQENLINDTSVFYKGMLGMILCLTPGSIIGLVFVKISLDQAKATLEIYQRNPNKFKPESLKKVKNGRIMAYIGLGLFIVEILLLVGYSAR